VTGVLIVAGEVSGDIHAGNMLLELAKIRPDVEAFGVGGDRLIAAGLDAVAHTDELAVMGLVEVVRELPRIRRVMHSLVDEAARRRPAVAVLVDSPDFNLRLAARLRPLGIPVVLYVSPQLWAWRRGRVRVVRRRAREVLCILPFETDFYGAHGVRARYVGHPLVDEIARVGLLNRSVTPVSRRLAMLPGSRSMEVSQLLPVMLRALETLPRDVVEEAVVVEAPGMEAEIDAVVSNCGADPRLRRARGEERQLSGVDGLGNGHPRVRPARRTDGGRIPTAATLLRHRQAPGSYSECGAGQPHCRQDGGPGASAEGVEPRKPGGDHHRSDVWRPRGSTARTRRCAHAVGRPGRIAPRRRGHRGVSRLTPARPPAEF